jgi:hypothetical protein
MAQNVTAGLDNPLLELRVELQERLVGTAGGCHAAAAAAAAGSRTAAVAAAGRYTHKTWRGFVRSPQGGALTRRSSSLGVVRVRQPQEERASCCVRRLSGGGGLFVHGSTHGSRVNARCVAAPNVRRAAYADSVPTQSQ